MNALTAKIAMWMFVSYGMLCLVRLLLKGCFVLVTP
jgi:hypothetical protein